MTGGNHMKTYEISTEFWNIEVQARHELEALSIAQRQTEYFPLNGVRIKEKKMTDTKV